MEFGKEVRERLSRLGPFRDRHEKLAVEQSGVRLEIDLEAADEFSCCFDELRLHARSMEDADTAALKDWAGRIGRTITYLLEQVQPLEVDADHGKVLLRSAPPDKRAAHTTYYELVVDRDGWLSLQRFRTGPEMLRRARVSCTCTREQVDKLVDDLAGSIE